MTTKNYNLSPFGGSSYEINGETFYTLQLCALWDERAFELFEQHGQYGNGPGWENLIVSFIMEDQCPELIDAFQFDDEAEFFMATTKNEEKMIRLGTIVNDIITNEEKLIKYLKDSQNFRKKIMASRS